MMKKTCFVLALALCAAIFSACATAPKQALVDGRTVYAPVDSRDLRTAAVVDGVVIDSETRKPIGGAIVEIKNASLGMGYYRRETGASGKFRVDDCVAHVRYIVEVTARGYVPFVTAGSLESGALTIKLQREAVLTGSVTSSSGKAIEGVEVRLNRNEVYYERGYGEERVPEKPVIAQTGPDGRYAFNRLPEGGYVITFQKEGYIAETAQVKHIKRGETFTLPMVLFAPASVAGTIQIQGIDAPAINMDVTLHGRATHSTSSFHDGSFRIEDIKPGNYKLTLTHEGFYKLDTPVLTIQEGEKHEGLAFTVAPKNPQVQVYAYRYTFAPGTKVEFNLKSFRLEKVGVKIYRVPAATLLQGRNDPNDIDPAGEKFKTVLSREDAVREFEPYEWRYQNIEFNEPLPPGGYCIEVSGAGKIVDRKFFTVTSVGVVAKRSPESVFAYATSLVDNTPLADATVIVFDDSPVKTKKRRQQYEDKPADRIENLPMKVLHRGKTGADGIYRQRMAPAERLAVMVLGHDGSYAFCSTGSPSSFSGEATRLFIYTDRPVYRAGDTVHYKVIGKKRDTRPTPLAESALFYEIRCIDFDRVVKSGSMRLDEWGVSDDSIRLDAGANLGEYEIRAGIAPDKLHDAGRFYVEQYRKPEFKIDLTPAKPFYANGDTLEFKVDAKYFFGAPLKGALVRYRFYETRLRDTDTSYWWEEDYGEPGGAYNRIRLEGDKYLDDSGIASLKLFCGTYPYDRDITLEATVVDRSNVAITSRASVKVGRGEYYIKINPSQNFYADDDAKKNIEIKAVAHDGTPVSAPVEVRVFRYIWKPWQRVYVHDTKPVAEVNLRTGKNGIASFELPKKFPSYGEFDIVASAKDNRDNAITASRVIWIYGRDGGRVESRFKNLELSLSETKLKSPGEVTCLVKSRFSDAYVCLTLEGRDIYESKVVKMDGNILPVKFNIKSDYAPNLFVTATMQRNRALFAVSSGIGIQDRDSALVISIAPDKARYMPGERATVRLKATGESGNPVKADLSLGVVDEAIYQIRSDHTPTMRDFFYAKISNWVLTNYSYPVTVLAGAAKDGRVKVREKFEDTAFWQAVIRTNENGEATVRFNVPDNLTTWRLTARGHDRNGRVGEKKSEMLVTQNLIARIGRPRFLTGGDTVGFIGIVNSNTPLGLQSVATEMKADGLPLAADEKIPISLPPYGSAREYYTVKVPEKKDAIQIYYAADGGPDAKDALKIGIPVTPRGVPYVMYGIGDMAGNRSITLTSVKNTADFEFSPSELVITVNPSPISRMIAASKYLAEYPYGCIEQTINKFLPNVALKRLLQQKGVPSALADEKLEDTMAEGIARIQNSQNDDGSWGWFSGDRGNEFITAYVLFALDMARRMGYRVDMGGARRGADAAGRMLRDDRYYGGDAKACLLYSLSLWGTWNDTAFMKLCREKNINAYMCAYLIRAAASARRNANLTIAERNNIAAQLTTLTAALKSMLKKDARGMYWESVGSQSWGWQGNATEITAHALSALLESGDTSTLPSQIVSSLSRRGRGDAWGSTKETASVMIALCKYLEAAGGAVRETGNIAFSLNGNDVGTIEFDGGSPDSLMRVIPLDGAPSASSYAIDARGTASPDVSFSVTLRGHLYFRDSGFLSFISSQDRSIQELENGVALHRGFSSVLRVRDINNSEYLVPQALTDTTRLKVGDEILVTVKFKAQDNFQYLVLEDYLPSGFEVVRQNAYDGYQPYSHIERRDNRMVYFFTGIRKGEVYEVGYIMRAELPGEFMVKPSRMECMYEPSIQGWSSPARFTVRKK